MAEGKMISEFYTFKPVDINTKVSEAIKQFENEGFQCKYLENSDNVMCELFGSNGEVIQEILLINSYVGEILTIEKVQVTNYI